MSNYRTELAELVQRYLKEAHQRDMSVADILLQPWHKVVGMTWRARVYFREPGWYATESDVPDPPPTDGNGYSVYLGPGKIRSYTYFSGHWSNSIITEDMYKP